MIGSLATLKLHLEKNNIYEFKSLKNVIDFQNSFNANKQILISYHKDLIFEERRNLEMDIPLLEQEIEEEKKKVEQSLRKEISSLNNKLVLLSTNLKQNILIELLIRMKQWHYKIKIKNKENNFAFKVDKSLRKQAHQLQIKNNRYHFITSEFSDAVKQSSKKSLNELEWKKSKIDELDSFIYGALGEQKVVKTLESLSDNHFLINDFSISFSKPLFNKIENEYIKSIQVDHLLVAPSGVFLIETKNWSNKSLESLSLRSPVKQIKRTSFVLFKLLNNEMSNFYLDLSTHHWGDRKIPIKNLIVLINNKPKEEFQYVKVLKLDELLGYINYFKPIFSNAETQNIAEFLVSINEQKVI